MAKDLEAAGFKRSQAEAQVQVVLDAIEGDLVTKGDFAVYQEKINNQFAQMDNRFLQSVQQIQIQIKESEFRLATRLGFLMVSSITIAVAVLTWLVKI